MAYDETRTALLEEIEKLTKEVGSITHLGGRAQVLERLALAFRYVDGGAQPGGSAPMIATK